MSKNLKQLFKYVRSRFGMSSTRSACDFFSQWFSVQGDKTLRLQYDLTAESVVFDLGGYEGQWASDIFSRYCCKVYIFEPVPLFATRIQDRFIRNPSIQVFPFGLSSASRTIQLSLDGDASSQHKSNSNQISVEVFDIAAFLTTHRLPVIDLMKINIEGAEFDLIEHMLDTGIIANIVDIQVQFHNFVPNSATRREQIHERLSATHYLTYNYPFVWENWRRLDSHTNPKL